ncbi:MAG: flagellar biosynthetic protein FliR [Planctomycetota bacterium]|nr:flagellar biosynthetic protein FliR [Planctomycetota bacterium]
MDALTLRIVPFVLILGRISAFFLVLPIYGAKGLPMRVRAGLALVLSMVFAAVLPVPTDVLTDSWIANGLLLVRETLTGLALGMAVALVFASIRQTGEVIRIQMGLAEAEIIDPLTGEEPQPLGMLLEMAVLVLFLISGGDKLLLAMIDRSYQVFPIGHPASAAVMADAVLEAGTVMLVYGLQLAAPMMGAFLLLAVLLAVIARAMPEMNVLMESLPLRVGLGLLMAAAMVPLLNGFTQDLGDWLSRFMTT